MNRFQSLLSIGLLTAAMLPLAAAPVDRTLKYGFLIGAEQHYAHDEGAIDETLSLMKQANFNTWRSDLRWPSWRKGKTLVRPKNIFLASKRSAELGITPILNLYESDPAIGWHFPVGKYQQPFIDFCVHAIKEMEGYTPILQLWNEWDGGHMMHVGRGTENTVDNYVALLKAAEPQIRKVAPDSVLVANSVCTGDKFLFELFEKGMQNYCDAYAIHTYNLSATPEEVYERLVNVEKMSAKYNHGTPKPFYVTEMGWYCAANCVSDKTQGDYVARLYLLLKMLPSCRGMCWYNMQERGFDPENPALYWGVMTYDYTPKDAFMAMASVAPVVRNATFVKRIPAADPNVWLLLYKLKDGRHVLAAWYNSPVNRIQVVLNRNGGKAEPLTVEVCGGKPFQRRWGFLNQYTHSGVPNNQVKENVDQFSFFCTSRPVLVYGVPADVKVEQAMLRVHREPMSQIPVMPRAVAKVLPRTGTTLNVSGDGAYRRIIANQTYGGAADLSFTTRLTHDRRDLKLEITVTDDQYVPVTEGARYWEGDSVQLGFFGAKADGIFGRKFHEYSLVRLPNGNAKLAKRFGTNFDAPTGATLTVKRVAPTKFIYTFTLPWSELGVDYEALQDGKAPLLFSVLVNDNDGKGRKGFLHWGDGLAEKDVSAFGWLIFEKAEALKNGELSTLLGTPARKAGWHIFPKAECEVTAVETTQKGRAALLLEGNFPKAKGGKNHMSVVMTRHVPQNIGKFKEVRVELYSPTEPYVGVLLVDATNQSFLHYVKIPSNDAWQTVTCSFDPRDANPNKPMIAWGGAKDRKFHEPLKSVQLLLDWSFRAPSPVFGVRGQIYFGKIELVTQKTK